MIPPNIFWFDVIHMIIWVKLLKLFLISYTFYKYFFIVFFIWCRYCQVGNAVAVPVGRALGYALGLAFQRLTGDEPLIKLPPNFSFLKPPIDDIVVLQNWVHIHHILSSFANSELLLIHEYTILLLVIWTVVHRNEYK